MRLKSRTNTGIKVASFLMAAVVCTAVFSGMPVTAARTVEDIRSEQAALAEKQEKLKSQISELESEAETSIEYQQKLDEEITVVEEQITASKKDIEDLDAGIIDLEKKVKESAAGFNEVFEKLKERVKAIYKTGSAGTLEILLNAESLQDYSMRAELMKNMTKHDKELMDTISRQLKDTEKERKELESRKSTLAELKKNLEAKSGELVVLEEKNRQAIEKLKENKVLTEQTLKDSYAFGNDLANEMAAIIASMAAPKPTPRPTAAPTPSAGPADGKKPDATPVPTAEPTPEPDLEPDPDSISFRWPCPDYAYISDHFGGDRGHKGLDIAANYGVPIVAAASGTVIMANNSDEWGYSWGYYVSLYHNSTYSTLYAHCSDIAVSNGQEVQQGEVIAYVGSTGNSNGNHLHFEVYEYGTRVDPEAFLG